MAQDGVASHCFGVWVQLDHDSQVLQWVLLQDSTANLLPEKKTGVTILFHNSCSATFSLKFGAP